MTYEAIGPRCPDCGQICFHDLGGDAGDEQVEAAANRWTCLGKEFFECDCSGEIHDKPHMRKVKCPGRADIVADPVTWAAWKRAMRVRTKTTVLDGSYALVLDGPAKWKGRGRDGTRDHVSVASMIPDGAEDRSGRWTVAVTFEPDPGPHVHVYSALPAYSPAPAWRASVRCVVCDEVRVNREEDSP